MRVVISYTDDGVNRADKLESDLEDQHIGVWIDKHGIEYGKTWLKEIDKSMYKNDYVLGIITPNYLESIGGEEAYAKIAQGLRKKDMKFLSLFFMPVKDVKSVFVPAMQGFKFYENYERELYNLVSFLKKQQKDDPKELLSKVEGAELGNPFRRVRAEHFHEDYKLIASAFAEPETEKYDVIREAKPIVIYGGRGSGKTMILKSLLPEVILSKYKVTSFEDARKKGLDFFSIYFRLKRGSLLIYDYHAIIQMGFLKTRITYDYELYKTLIEKLKRNQIENEPVLTAGLDAAWVVSLNELNLKILQTTLENLIGMQEKRIINISRECEEQIVRQITQKLDATQKTLVKTFQDLFDFVYQELQKIERYLQSLALPCANPIVNWCHSGLELLDNVYKIITELVPDLKGINVYLLFDEMENLRPFQQITINEWIKTSKNFTVKVASKFNGIHTHMTQQGQALQDGQDYFTFVLDYDLFDPKKNAIYQNLLLQISKKLLEIEGFKETDLRKQLQSLKEPELPIELVNKEIEEIRRSAGLEFSEDKLDEYRNKMDVAAIFRLLRKRERIDGRSSKKKLYAGFETYSYLSSGIIRIFLNLVGMAFYKAAGGGVAVKEGEPISTEDQTWAAYTVSKAWLEKIPVNIEEHGEIMYQFVVDVGSVLRERLLHHSSEPETLTISLKDPSNLKGESLLESLLMHSVMESILYEKMLTSSMKPKIAEKISKEYALNRIYAPVLELSYRPRWPRGSEFSVNELSSLLDPEQRDEARRKLQKRQRSKVLGGTKELLAFKQGSD